MWHCYVGTVSSLVLVIVIPILIYEHFVKAEERMLAERFGAEGGRHRARVRRWLSDMTNSTCGDG